MLDRFINKVMSWVKRRQLLRPGDRVVIGVSGGADSMALLEALCWAAQSRAWHLEIHVAHYDHRLRGEASALDAEFVREQAERKNLPFHCSSGEVRAYARAHRMNLEQACRHLRYDFLRELAAGLGADRIATGHTMSDQAETFLMRLLRGAGGEGLASIRPLLDGLIARPLLGVTREEVREFCVRKSIPFREDQSNLDLRFLRNRVRLEILPSLAPINPQIVSSLARTAALLAAAEEYLQQSVRSELDRVRSRSAPARAEQDTAQQLRFSRRELARVPDVIRRRLLREAVRMIKGDLTRLTAAHVEAIDRLVTESQSGRQVRIPGGVIARREFDEFIVEQESEPVIVLSETIEAETERIIGPLHLRVTLRLAGQSGWEPDDRRRAVLDAEKVRMPVMLRARKPGERYVPCGKTRPVAVKDVMLKKRIPESQRGAHPVFASAEDEFIWSPGLPIASKFRIEDTTKRVLILTCEAVEGGHNR